AIRAGLARAAGGIPGAAPRLGQPRRCRAARRGARFGLPALPISQVVLYSRVREPRSADTLRRFTASLAASA
ncbi:LysR family transcriptional regulator, partial [Burkholderia gladioli]|nr:LysR family transcriptional regulator [Burkholderia gladioli]